MVHRVYLLLGSNLGDRANNLISAAEQLSARAGTVVQQSRVYETLPWGVDNQPNYWNQVLALATEQLPDELLQTIHRIESDMGRKRRVKWESRLIDIDILYYDALTYQSDTLTIPHPQLANRRFTLVPLAEIAPDFVHPVLGISNRKLLARCPDKLAVTPVEE